MSRFERAVEFVLEHEGGLVNNPNDPGGVTNYGVSLRWAMGQMRAGGDDLHDLLDVDGDGDVDADDIRLMDRSTAIEVYRMAFWKPHGYDQVFHQAVATKVFDTTVNMGHVQSHKGLQRALRAAGQDVNDDGQLGPATRAAIARADAGALLAAMRSEQAGFYRMLIARNAALRKEKVHVPDFSVFQSGWLRRAYS